MNTIRTYTNALSFVSLFLVIGCQSPVEVDYDRSAVSQLQNYRSFTIEDRDTREGYGNIALSPIVDRRIAKAIQFNLEDKGFAYRKDAADFKVHFHTLTKEQTEVHDLSVGPPPFGRSPYFGDYSYSRILVDKYEEGTLVIDIIDIASNELVWRGAHVRRLQRKALNLEELQIVVDSVLLNFPPLSSSLLN